MKKFSILFLQVVVVIIGIAALAVLIRFPQTEGRAQNLDLLSIYLDPLILYGYLASLPFFFALFKIFQLLVIIKQNNLFSSKSIRILKSVKYAAITVGSMIVLAGIYVRFSHPADDDPAGFLAMCIAGTFISLAITTAVAVFEKIIQNAVDIKHENDLTI